MGLGGEILTDLSHTNLPSNQSGLLPQRWPCHHRSWERPSLLLQGHMGTLPAVFCLTYRCSQGNTMLGPTEATHTDFTFAYHWLPCHYHPQNIQGRHLSYFEAHKWSTSLMVTKPHHSARPHTFKHLILVLMKSATIMNPNEDPLLFPHQAYAEDENLKPTRSDILYSNVLR